MTGQPGGPVGGAGEGSSDREPRSALDASWQSAADEGDAAGASPAGRRWPTPRAIGRVLVLLDGTRFAERALPFAAALAGDVGAGVTLAHISARSTSPTLPRRSGKAGGVLDDRLGEEVADFATYLQRAQGWMTDTRSHLHDVETVLIDAMSVRAGLIASLEREGIGLVVIATHARRGVERTALGGTADALIRAGRAPVLAIAPQVDIPPAVSPPARVLVPLDGSELAERVLATVPAVACEADRDASPPREVVLFGVGESASMARGARRYLDGVRRHLAPLMRARISVRVVEGAADTAIVAAANVGLVGLSGERERPDLIVMATHGRSGLGRWLLGSVAGYVLSHARVPVLLVCPPPGDATRHT